ncbi:sensor histidine kinase [Xanthobacter agilis]|uniref:histidine kinase n=2 Tax=Xanthobacter agilis TaxID=47492 RepID=A0ABU0L9I6_XANAG|nr:PAS-domain containing protein [Xanthobacter agilis]MDQ0503786.1 signal transduction histidine kinase [Xanthobacter agilis]
MAKVPSVKALSLLLCSTALTAWSAPAAAGIGASVAGASVADAAPWLAVLVAGAAAAAAWGFGHRRVAAADAAATAAEARADEAAGSAARARAEAHSLRHLLGAGADCTLVWLRAGEAPQAFGAQGFGTQADVRWLGAAAAREVDAAVAALRGGQERLDRDLTAADGRAFRLAGRALGGAGMLMLHRLPAGEGPLERETRAGLQAMLDAAPAPAWLRADDGTLTYVNPAFVAAVGASSSEDARAQGLDLLDSKARAAAASAEQGSGAFRGRVRAVARGQRRQLDVVEVAGPFGIAGLAVDVTDLEAARAETARTVAAHRRTLDQLTTAVAIFGADERLVFHNAAYERLFDFSPAFLDQRPSDGQILDNLRTRRKVPEQADFPAWRAQLREAYRALEPVNDWWHLPGGEMLRVVITPNAEGGVTYLFDDLSEHVALESRYNTLIRIQGETLDALAEAVAVFGSEGRLHLYNEAFLSLWELDAQTLGDKPHIDAVAALCRSRHGESAAFSRIRSVVTAMEHREAQNLRLERADGRVLDGTAQPLPDGGTLVTFRDVTDSVKVERALIERAEALEAADRLKNAFVSHVSYHLRTPLNTLMGYADMLREGLAGPLNTRQRDYLDHMRQSSDQLRALIDDILDLASIDAGAMELDLAEVDVREMLESVAEAVHDQVEEAGVRLAMSVPADAGRFMADPKRVRQILFNLLANAIAASPEGGTVTLGAERRSQAVLLAVRDEGPGVPPELAETLFERFESRNANPRHRGVGLGLAIVRSFMTLHGGSVSVVPASTRQPGARGTLATCVFPLSGSSHQEAA